MLQLPQIYVPQTSLMSQWLEFLTPLSIAFLAIVNVWAAKRAAAKAEAVKAELKSTKQENANRAEEVKTTLEQSTVISNTKLGEIHALVNSERGVLLEMYASAMEVNAKLTKDPKAIEAAKVARAMVEDHKAKQAASDAAKASAKP
jgi:hypothetical protein